MCVLYNSDYAGFNFRIGGGHPVHTAYNARTEPYNDAGAVGDDCPVYYHDTLEAAEAMAMYLTQKYPYNSYMTAKTLTVFHREPGKLNRAAFTEKGLLPA